jgi:serine/threonine protein phosphatase PrpC
MSISVLQITALTHHGRVHDGNEDTVAVDRWIRSEPMRVPYQWLLPLEFPVACIVADGMGGHAAGEIASQHVAIRLGAEARDVHDVQGISTLLQRINLELYDLMSLDPSRAGMGSTVVGIVVREGYLIWFNIGDSRLYEARDGYLTQISIDDSPECRAPSSKRQTGVLTQSLGGPRFLDGPIPHVGIVKDIVPSRWLLCSDGLTDMLDLEVMEACMNASDLEASILLIDAANEAGGGDNISAIILTIVCEDGLEVRY